MAFYLEDVVWDYGAFAPLDGSSEAVVVVAELCVRSRAEPRGSDAYTGNATFWMYDNVKESAVVPFYEPAARLCSSATFMCCAPERATLACDRQYDGYRSSGVWQFRRL